MLTSYLVTALNRQVFGGVEYRPSATYSLGLSITTPTPTGRAFTEPKGGGYERVIVPNTTDTFIASPKQGQGQTQTNAAVIAFPESLGTWGTVEALGVFDEQDRLVAVAQMPSPIRIERYSVLKFEPYTLEFQLA